MTAKQFKAAMRRIIKKYSHDRETMHIEMDKLMCKLLTELGYEEGVKVFQETDRWYA